MLSVLRLLSSFQISLLWWEIRGFEVGDAFADSVNLVNSVKTVYLDIFCILFPERGLVSLEVIGKVVKPLRSTTTRSSWFGRLVRLGEPTSGRLKFFRNGSSLGCKAH